jgi:hypothetical protein
LPELVPSLQALNEATQAFGLFLVPFDTDEWCSLLKDLLPPVEELVFGAVVAIADLTDCILMTEEFINQQSETELRCGWIPENFLEETEPQPQGEQKPKGRQRKGCLYRYIENKKLKDGTIASYPRVIGHRQPDNPTHWRWGFNWEEKIDGEWKGRSIGSVPLGAIALIQSMQKEGVSLEEIVGFIRRAKSKK